MNYSAEAKTSIDSLREDPLVDDVGRMLDALQLHILELWNHPTVKTLIAKRKLLLDEWEELWVHLRTVLFGCALTHGCQFLARYRPHRLAWLHAYNRHVHLMFSCLSYR
jgi:hypothetical protein